MYSNCKMNILFYNKQYFDAAAGKLFCQPTTEVIIMATLQATRQGSAFTAQARLKLFSHKPASHPFDFRPTPEASPEHPTLPPEPNMAQPDHDQLTDLQLRQLLLQAATIYPGWQLVSVEHRPTSDVLVASLVRSQDRDDPTHAIREGRVLQIIMDASGDLRIHHPHRRHAGLLTELFRWLATAFRPQGLTAFAQAW